ncbi:unnamed protein product, partial [Phaeothamnion confervicola]
VAATKDAGGGGAPPAAPCSAPPLAGSAHPVVDEFLALYSAELSKFCRAAGVPAPALVGLGDRMEAGRTRFATGPLRRYVDLLGQRQAAATVRGSGFLDRRRLAETVAYLTWRSNRTRAAADAQREQALWGALAADCARQMRATGLSYAVFEGRATGAGRDVALP